MLTPGIILPQGREETSYWKLTAEICSPSLGYSRQQSSRWGLCLGLGKIWEKPSEWDPSGKQTQLGREGIFREEGEVISPLLKSLIP